MRRQPSFWARSKATGTFFLNCSTRSGSPARPLSPDGISPASKLKSATERPAPAMAASTSPRSSPEGHQNSTAEKPASLARPKRCRKGTSLNRIETFALNLTGPPRISWPHPSGPLEEDILGALPEAELAQRSEVLVALGHGHEVVGGELAELAPEDRAVVGEQNLRLRVAAGVEQDLTRLRHARRVLPRDPEVVVAQGDPARLPAPPHVDDLLPVRQQLLERLNGLRTPLPLPPRHELVRTRRYLYVAQCPVFLPFDRILAYCGQLSVTRTSPASFPCRCCRTRARRGAGRGSGPRGRLCRTGSGRVPGTVGPAGPSPRRSSRPRRRPARKARRRTPPAGAAAP